MGNEAARVGKEWDKESSIRKFIPQNIAFQGSVDIQSGKCRRTCASLTSALSLMEPSAGDDPRQSRFAHVGRDHFAQPRKLLLWLFVHANPRGESRNF